jgi:hypothetical protein
MHESPGHETTFGYLSAIHTPEHGWFGGYLIVSPLGRPLEFHCTAPVLPTRAQQILYGPTLSSYLIGEQIGGSLIAAAKLIPRLVLTDQAEFGDLGSRCKVPMVLVLATEGMPTVPTTPLEDLTGTPAASSHVTLAAHPPRPPWCNPFRACSHVLQVSQEFASQREFVVELIKLLAERVDLSEPFERIHGAIREAQRVDARGQEYHGQAA